MPTARPFFALGTLLTTMLASVAAGAQSAAPATRGAPSTMASASAPTSAANAASTPAGPQRVLSLAQAERAALEQQPQLMVARANTAMAQALADQARAPLLPQVTGQASYTRETGNYVVRPGSVPVGVSAPGGSVFSTSYDYWSFGVTGTQLLYDFGQTSERYKAASLTADVNRITELATRLQIVLGVRTAYFAAAADKDLVDVARDTVDDQNKHLAQVLGYVQAGTQPPIALAQQKAACANAMVQLIQARNNYETAKANLNSAAGISGGTEYDVAADSVAHIDDEDQGLDGLVAKAILARPEIATYAKQVESQQAALSAARGGYGPTLSAAAGASEAGLTLNGLVPNWNAGLLLNWPIFQGGLTQGQIRQAEAGLQGIEAQKALEIFQVRLQVNSAWLSVSAAKSVIDSAEDAAASAREQLRLAEQRFATGVGNIIELNDAQVASTTAAAQVVQARYTLATARAQLLAALGRI